MLLFKLGAGGLALAAPPAAPADARGSLAVHCPGECGEIELGAFAMKARLPETASQRVMVVIDQSEAHPRPREADLQAWGEGDVAGMARSQQVVLLRWAAPREQGMAALADALEIATRAGPWIEDLDTGRRMDAKVARSLIAEARSESPDLSRLIVLEPHENLEGPSLLTTRGLLRLGLPELVEVGVPTGKLGEAGARMNALAQALYEQGAARGGPASTVQVDAARFRSETARQAGCELKGTATLSYDRGNKAILGAGLRASLDGFQGGFGACAAPAASAPAESLASVRARAMRRLKTEIRAAWAAGLPAGDRLMVKAPFLDPEGNVEWLWLQVERWEGDDTLKGRLVSSPSKAAGVQKGDPVQARLDVVFDWLWIHKDGRREGNETQAWL